MGIYRKALVQLLAALLIGLAGAIGTLLLLSQGASARPMLQEGHLVISKVESADPVQVGAHLVYTLTYQNTSTDTAMSGVIITDTLDPNVIYATASLTPDGWAAQNAPYWIIGTLPESVSEMIVLTVTVNNLLPNGTILTNTATIDSNETASRMAQISTTVDAPTLELIKNAEPDPVTTGAPLTYTLAYSNTGDATAAGVVVTDVLDSNVTFVSASLSPTGWTTPTLYWDIGTLTPSALREIVISVTVQSGLSDGTTLTNSATIDSQQTASLSVTETTSVVSHSTPAYVALAPATATITAGQSISYTLIATDTFGNSWDATASGTYTITAGAGGSWATNVYISQVAGSWTVTGTVGTIPATAALTVTHASAASVSLAPPVATITAGQSISYTLTAYDACDNHWDVTFADQTTFSILEAGHGGYWTGNVYTSSIHGDWTVQGAYAETYVTTGTASLTVLAPVLHFEKSADLDLVEAGAYLTYTLTYSNTGNQTATGGVVTDTLDPHVSYVTASLTPTGGLPDAPFWSIGDITPGELSQVRVTVSVNRPLPNGTVLTNTAWLDADRTPPLSATQETTVHSSPVLTITKADYPDPVDANGVLRYTLIITNSGNENATPVTVTEHYDPNVAFFSSIPNPDDLGSGNRIWTFTTLDVDESQTINIFVRVAGSLPVSTVMTNQVTLDSDQTTPITATEVTSVTSVSDFTFYKIDLSDPVEAGEELQYVIHYDNSGTADAHAVVITETYDSRVTFDRANPPPKPGTDNVWEIAELHVGEFGDIAVTVLVDTPLPNGTMLTNCVEIDSAETSPRSFTETTRVSSSPDLALSVTDQPDPVEAGDPLAYTLRYTNTGNADATQVVVTATLDANVSYVTASPTPTGGADHVWYWEIDNIHGEGEVGEIVIYTAVTLPLTNSTMLDFATQLEDAEGDFLEDTAQTTVSSAPVLSLYKSDGVYTVYAGDRLTYTLTYANSGNENAYDVTITDTLSSYVEYVDCEIPGGDWHFVLPNEVVLHIPAVIAQTSGQAWLVVQVNDPLPAGADFVINHARMTSPSLPVPIDVQDVDPIGTLPDLIIAADHAPSLFSPGKLMTYTVIYSNTGRMGTADVIITTILPTGTVYVDVGYDWHSFDGRTYTCQVGNLPAGSTVYTIPFTVVYPDQSQIGAPEFNTPFTIAESGSAGGDANPGDNTAYVYIGVPDLVVTNWAVDPWPLQPDVLVTFTIVLMNQGTGWAWNPANHAGFWVDVFITPVASYPWERYSEKDIWAGAPALAPGAEYTLVITLTGTSKQPIQFSEQEIWEEIEEFYVKVDNYAEPVENEEGRIIGWTSLYGLVPEYDEMNNLGMPINPDSGLYHIYLPLTCR